MNTNSLNQSQVPEQGQLVETRHRQWLATDIKKAEQRFIRNQLGIDAKNYHLVTLASIEDDSLHEEIQIVWEIERGSRVFQKSELPEVKNFDKPQMLDAFLDAVKWGAASTTDSATLQAPFRSGIEIEDYQLDPLVRAIQMPRVNLLVADAVGLGKTIEAGLVMQEMAFRHLARCILIVCPSALQIQWKEEMRDRFGLEFHIVDSEMMHNLRRTRGIHANPWSHHPRLITSIDYLKRDHPLRLFKELLPHEGESPFPRRFDLLILDEAHNIAPSGTGKYATDSKRTNTIRIIEPHFEHKLFLTATPHNGYSESFTALLEILDPQRFARGIQPDRRQLQNVMVRRLRDDILNHFGEKRFPERQLDYVRVKYTDDEREAHRRLQEYGVSRLKRAASESSRYASEFILKLLKKRLFSSPVAFSLTMEKHLETVARHYSERIAGVKQPVTAPKISLLRGQLEDRLEEEFGSDDDYSEILTETVLQASEMTAELIEEERNNAEWLCRWARKFSSQPDSKAQALINWLKNNLMSNGAWTSERVIIFTEYRDTQKWLLQLFANAGLTADERVLTLYGGMTPEDREQIKAAFQASPRVSKVRILLATDAASEGINLQNHCSRLFHYEIPWNPNRMEQRNGRVDRYGQNAKEVNIFHFVGSDFNEREDLSKQKPGELEGDLEFLARAVQKVHTIREDLGKVGQVISEQVELAMLGKIARLDTSASDAKNESIKKLLKFERKMQDEVQRFRAQLQETKKRLRLSPGNIERVVHLGLKLAGQPPLIPVEKSPGEYNLPALTKSWASCINGLEDKFTNKIRPLTFDSEIARHRDDIVLAHLNHRLVQMCLRLLRAEVWASDSARKINRVTARLASDEFLTAPAIIAHGRIVVVSDDKHRLHEEVITAGGILRDGRFERLNRGDLQDALGSETDDFAPDFLRDKVVEKWEDLLRKPVQSALEARARERSQSLEKNLSERVETEIQKLTGVLTELRSSIQQELTEPDYPVQLELFSTPEKEQFEKNKDALRCRLEEIPAEIERETEAIRRRYSNPRPLLFPLAVTILFPKRMAQR